MPALSGGMTLYSRRSAKSVACSRLKVMGVSAFFFLPVRVAALTRADEFHSVTNTRWPSALSHFARSASCVVLPEPSIPSTTKSLPGYSCVCVRLFSIGVRTRICPCAAGLDAKRLASEPYKWRRMTRRRPEFQFRVARCPQLQQVVIAAVVQVEADDGLRVTAVEALGQPKNRRQRAHDAPFAAAQIAEADMPALRRRLAMIARGERDDFNLVGLEAAQIAVLDQVVRVFVV